MSSTAPLGRSVTETFVPRPGGGLRRLAVLGPGDGAAYTRLVARVTPDIERGLGPEVFANRAPGGYRLEPWRGAWARWRRAAERLARAAPIAAMDVATCYDTITPEAVGRALGSFGISPSIAGEIMELLKRFREAGVPGIPVGPEPSAILANAVLASVDGALREAGVPFVRWVDDFILAGDVRTLGKGELAVEAALGSIGLASNPAKHRRGHHPGSGMALLGPGRGLGSGLEILAGP